MVDITTTIMVYLKLSPEIFSSTPSAIVLASPVENKIDPKLRPEPNKRREAQSISIAFSSPSIFSPLRGRVNKREAKKMETTPAGNLLLNSVAII